MDEGKLVLLMLILTGISFLCAGFGLGLILAPYI